MAQKPLTIATDLMIDELISDLETSAYDMSDEAYKIATKDIHDSRAAIQEVIQEVWQIIQEEQIEHDPESQVIFIFDYEGEGFMDYFGVIDFWQGASWDQYPYRAYAYIPRPEDV